MHNKITRGFFWPDRALIGLFGFGYLFGFLVLHKMGNFSVFIFPSHWEFFGFKRLVYYVFHSRVSESVYCRIDIRGSYSLTSLFEETCWCKCSKRIKIYCGLLGLNGKMFVFAVVRFPKCSKRSRVPSVTNTIIELIRRTWQNACKYVVTAYVICISWLSFYFFKWSLLYHSTQTQLYKVDAAHVRNTNSAMLSQQSKI